MSSSQRVWLVRHAEAQHNVDGDYSQRDPALTSRGIEQARAIPSTSKVSAVSSRPSDDTTTTIGFNSILKRVPVVVLPELQEAGPHPCDIGSPASVLREQFAEFGLNFDRCTDGWYEKTGRMAATDEALLERARFVRGWLRDRPERSIVVVSHYAFLSHLIGKGVPRTHGFVPPRWLVKAYHTYEWLVGREGWSNAQMRLYGFRDDDAMLVRTPLDVQQPPNAKDKPSGPEL